MPPLDLSRLGIRQYVSQSALAAVLKAIQEADELPTGISRGSIKRAREAAVDVNTPYGPIFRTWNLERISGPAATVYYCQPAAMLFFLARSCSKLAAFLQQRLQECPCDVASPWSIIFYNDEVSPGNQLKTTNSRKLQALYFSFKEMGCNALCHERAWFLLGAVRSNTVQELKDGMGQLCKEAMLSFYAEGASFCRGVQLRLLDRPAILCATVGCLLSDESALKHMVNNKGASGKVPCCLCRNVVQKRYAPENMHRALVHHTCLDETKFLQHTRESLAECVAHLAMQSGRLNKGQFDDLQTRLGFNHAPSGMLACRELMEVLDVPKAVCFDYMHVYFVSGLFHVEVNLMMHKLTTVRIRGSDIHRFFQNFTWPNFLGSKGRRVLPIWGVTFSI